MRNRLLFYHLVTELVQTVSFIVLGLSTVSSTVDIKGNYLTCTFSGKRVKFSLGFAVPTAINPLKLSLERHTNGISVSDARI